MAISLFLAEAGDCPGCGHPKSECWVEDADAVHEYIAEEAKCLVCARLEDARSGTKTEKGLHYYIERHPKGTVAVEAAVIED